ADAEHRRTRGERVAQQLDLAAQPRQALRVAHVHAAAEHHERVRAGRLGLAGRRRPLDQLRARRRGPLAQDAGVAAAGVEDSDDAHRAPTLAGSGAVHEGRLALIVGGLLAAGLAASLLAGRLRLPGLVLV